MAKKIVDLVTTEPTSTALSTEMMNAAKEATATFESGAARISFKAGRINIDGQPVKDNKLTVAVITTVLAKAYYDKPYEEGVPGVPVCYAFHESDPKQLVPHAAAPKKQHDTCVGCPLNKFNTATIGKGKACRDEIRVMAVVPSEDMGGAESRMFTITGNSIKMWNEYIKKLQMIGRAPRIVLTEVSTEPFKSTFHQTFRHVTDLTQQQFMALTNRVEAARSQMQQPYPEIEVEEEEAPKKGRKGGKF